MLDLKVRRQIFIVKFISNEKTKATWKENSLLLFSKHTRKNSPFSNQVLMFQSYRRYFIATGRSKDMSFFGSELLDGRFILSLQNLHYMLSVQIGCKIL